MPAEPGAQVHREALGHGKIMVEKGLAVDPVHNSPPNPPSSPNSPPKLTKIVLVNE
jgi:hypothetical protein